MTTYGAALSLAEQLIGERVRSGLDEDVVVDEKETRETDHFWVFFYNTRTYLETGAISHALLGNGPVLVEKATGIARIGRSDLGWEEQVRA